MVNFHAQVHHYCQLFYMATVVMAWSRWWSGDYDIGGSGDDGGRCLQLVNLP